MHKIQIFPQINIAHIYDIIKWRHTMNLISEFHFLQIS